MAFWIGLISGLVTGSIVTRFIWLPGLLIIAEELFGMMCVIDYLIRKNKGVVS
jgi:hypothetical protein